MGDDAAPPAQMVLSLKRRKRKPPLRVRPPVKHLVGALSHIQPQSDVVLLLGRAVRQFGLVGRLVVHNHNLVLVQFFDEALGLVLSNLLRSAERAIGWSKQSAAASCVHP
jgi:hypothetical protein